MTQQAFPKPKHKRKANHSRRNATRSRARMIRDLDAIARQEVFERDCGFCIRCQSGRNLQWAHVLSRRHLCVRWQPENAMTLCAGCHLFWHHEPALAVDWFIKNYRERFELIERILRVGLKVNVRALWEARAGEREGGE